MAQQKNSTGTGELVIITGGKKLSGHVLILSLNKYGKTPSKANPGSFFCYEAFLSLIFFQKYLSFPHAYSKFSKLLYFES